MLLIMLGLRGSATKVFPTTVFTLRRVQSFQSPFTPCITMKNITLNLKHSIPTGLQLHSQINLQCFQLELISFIRWSAENKANMNPNAYLPFGIGPRNCVGMRFAMEEIKIALCTIVKNFRFFPVAETPVRILKYLFFCSNQICISYCYLVFIKEEIQFEDGLVAVVQPVNFVVGIELRQK